MQKMILEIQTREEGMAGYWDNPSHGWVNIEFIGKFSDESKNFIVIRPDDSFTRIKDLKDIFLPIDFKDAKMMAKNILSIIELIENNQKQLEL